MTLRQRIADRDRTLMIGSVVGTTVLVGSLAATGVIAADLQHNDQQQVQQAREQSLAPAKSKPQKKQQSDKRKPAGRTHGS